MSDPAVIDWDRIIHKNVRSKDMQGAGNVVAIDGDSVIISTQGAQHQYKIPKSHVEGYNGAEVFLDIAVSDMSSFNTDNDNNIKAQTNIKEAGTLSNAESSVLPVKITKTSSQTPMIQGQEVQSKKEEGKEASEVSKQQYIKKEKVLANGIIQESAKVPIPSVATKTIATTTTTNITSSKTHSYNNNKPEKTQQGAITTTAGLPGQRVNNDSMQKEQGLGKKEETISSIREGGPVKSEVTVRPTQSITTTANKTSTLPSKPTTQTQSKNNMPAPPPSSLTTKTLAEPPEKILSEEAEEAAVEKAVTRAGTEESSSMTDDVKIQQQNRQEIENEVPTTTSTIQRQENIQPEVEVTIKPPNNIEFNPPISAENVSTAIEVGIDGSSSAIDDIRGPEEKEKEQQHQDAFHEEKIDNDNKYPINNLTPFAIGIALWQQSMVYWIDIYNEFATNAAQVTQYWFNAFRNTRIGTEQKNSEKIKGE